MIENETIISLASAIFKGPAAVAVLGGLLAVFLWVLIKFRTNSSHAIFRWIWRLVAGKLNSDDADFNKFMEMQQNLTQYRFVIGEARTWAQMHSIIKWVDRHNEDVRNVYACGPHFDRERPGLKAQGERPTARRVGVIALEMAGIALLTGAFLIPVITPGAFIIVKETKKSLLVNMQSTVPVFGSEERLTRGLCQQPTEKIAARTGFSQTDVTAICGFYADPALPKYIDQTVLQQRWSFSWFVLMFLWLFWTRYIAFAQGTAANEMATRLNRPRP